jgi:deazaflavin-dependent oxidoreductase (nitroreductase family)
MAITVAAKRALAAALPGPIRRKMSVARANRYNNRVIAEFRANNGVPRATSGEGPLLLLTTTGARTGKARTTPLVYSREGERLVVIASASGAEKHPAWYHNLCANPEVVAEVGTESFRARASVPPPPERDRLFAQHAAAYPAFNDFQAATSRVIPAVVLERL